MAEDVHWSLLSHSKGGAEPNGKKITQRGIHRFTFKNGRVTEWIGTEDTALSFEAVNS